MSDSLFSNRWANSLDFFVNTYFVLPFHPFCRWYVGIQKDAIWLSPPMINHLYFVVDEDCVHILCCKFKICRKFMGILPLLRNVKVLREMCIKGNILRVRYRKRICTLVNSCHFGRSEFFLKWGWGSFVATLEILATQL